MKNSRFTATATDRLKKIMLSDKLTLDNDAIKMLHADVNRVLLSYFEFNADNLRLDVYMDENKKYRLDVTLVAEAILPIKSIK